jgi:hypothetical protein
MSALGFLTAALFGLAVGHTLEWWRAQWASPDFTREPLPTDYAQNAYQNTEYDASHLAGESVAFGQMSVPVGHVESFPEGGVGG